MSAENSRLTRAIQRIAREDPELRRAIDATKPRGDQAGGLGVGESDGERDRICCDGSTSDNANPGSDTRDPSDNAKDGLDPDDPADISDNLTGVVDCETGVPICFEGSDWIPPEGWEDAQTPGPDHVADDSYWTVRYGLNFQHRFRVRAQALAFWNSQGWATICSQHENPETGHISGIYSNAGDCDGSFIFNFSITSSGCIPSMSACNEVYTPKWEEDNCVNLSIEGGKIVGSKYDPENDGSYSAPRDSIELCDGDGSILIRPSSGGGWKSINSLDGDIDPGTGAGYLYAPNGRRIRQVSPSEFRDDTV